MKKTIVAIAAAAFFATGMLAAAPAFAAGETVAAEMRPAAGARSVAGDDDFEARRRMTKFKPVKPYGKKTRTSL